MEKESGLESLLYCEEDIQNSNANGRSELYEDNACNSSRLGNEEDDVKYATIEYPNKRHYLRFLIRFPKDISEGFVLKYLSPQGKVK